MFAPKYSMAFTATNFSDSHKLTLTFVYFSEPGEKNIEKMEVCHLFP
jgi:hypothetical protein